ncbi:restriction endonuclease subunit S [Aeromonas dhakensis]|uniref:restriction endonuclease subunit S n=1 Tax=Aeromonas dhakensis TaxID=196024 RepID=UPI002E381B50|nr:restriction endonuclease subunit S [Aeromonas dhakensis]MED7774404.1 restriction endonuclease subunit S [Aeromonas dhakensis]
MAIEKLITDHLDLWTAAVRPKSSAGRGSNSKLELTGIKKLRELILELAVRGKLVPQDPGDEPASVLLERIAAEKTRLVKEGKIKKPKALPEISEEEQYFDLPSTWSWVRLNDIADYNGRPNIEPNNIKGDVWLLDLEDIEKDTSKLLYRAFYEERESKSNKSTFKCGDVLYGKLRPYLNKVIIADLDGVCTTEIVPIVPGDGLHPAYLKYLLKSPAFQRYVNSLMYGVKMPRLGTEDAIKSVHPLPPLAEQHRIVAKVDELMALCDQLEQCSESQLAAHQTLVETLLATLTDSCDADELAQNWARLSTHFDTLFTTETSIDALKQTILQLAVTGTLVSWGNNVREEKLKNCISFGPRNGFSPKETTEDTGFYVLKLGATSYGSLNLTEIKNIDVAIEKESHLFIRKNDILIQRGNSANYVGSNCLVECDVDGIIYPDLMMKIMVNHKVSAKYLSLWLSSPRSRCFMWDRMTGTSGTMPKISKKVVEEIPVMVPLMACQNDIVAKVDELMTLCDQLKSRLQTSQKTHLKLVDALVEQAL